jgi:hypothetical protein
MVKVKELMDSASHKHRGPDKKKRKPRNGYAVGTQIKFGSNKQQGLYQKSIKQGK